MLDLSYFKSECANVFELSAKLKLETEIFPIYLVVRGR